MTTQYFQISNNSSTTFDMTIRQITKSVLHDLNISEYIDDKSISINNDRNFDSSSEDENEALRLGSDNRCIITSEEITNPKNIKWMMDHLSSKMSHGRSSLNTETKIPLFYDQDSDIRLYELSQSCNIKLSFKIFFKDKDLATKLESLIVNKYHGDAAFNLHDINYSYPIGMDVASSMMYLYKLKKSYNKTYVNYLQEYSTKEISLDVSKHDNNEKRLMVRKNNLNTLALLEYDQDKPMAKEAGKLSSGWEIEFEYTLQFSKPDSLSLTFPSVIENQLVPNEMIPMGHDSNFKSVDLCGLFQEHTFNAASNLFYNYKHIITRLPYYDNFYPTPNMPINLNKFKPIFISVLTLDDGITSINLNKLGDIKLHPTCLELIEKHGKDIFNLDGIFNISVYSNGYLVDASKLTIDSSLTIFFKLSDRIKRYHLVLSEATDEQYMTMKYLSLLLNYRWFNSTFVLRNIERLRSLGILKTVASRELILLIKKLYDMKKISFYIKKIREAKHCNSDINQMYTMYNLIEYLLHKRSDITNKFLMDELLFLLDRDNFIVKPYPKTTTVLASDNSSYLNKTKDSGHGSSTPIRKIKFIVQTK